MFFVDACSHVTISRQQVVYVTATAPYILLTVLLIRGLTLDGAMDGVMWYITPDLTRLSDPQVLSAPTELFECISCSIVFVCRQRMLVVIFLLFCY